MADIAVDTTAYLGGKSSSDSSLPVYIYGVERSHNSGYTKGNILVSGSQSVCVMGITDDSLSKAYCYCYGITRGSAHVYLGGVYMASVDYIWLKTSDGSVEKKFRVIAQDYDDGTHEKAENVNKTIGGGVDHSVGAVYITWSPIIRVRQSEPETDYGDKDDLEYFYGLNNPNGTPSNDITFIDHHSVEYTIHTVGKLTKNAMGCQIEGEDAWFLYRLQFLRVQ